LDNFGPLWDQGLSTAEASGQIIKALYLATNRQSKDVCLQILTRFNENFFFDHVLPRVLLPAGAPPHAPPPAAVAPPPPPPAPAAPAGGGGGAQSPPLNVTALKNVTKEAPVTATALAAAWSAAYANGAPLPASTSTNVVLSWMRRAHLERAATFKKVCNVTVDDGAVLLQYINNHDERALGVRVHHDHTYQPVHTARLLRVKGFFTATPKDGGKPPRDYCLAQLYKPLLPAEETPRSLEFSLYKPRTLAFGWVIVPASELSHPLRHFPFYANPPPVLWTPLKKAVPVAESLPQPNTILVSTRIRW
jgi:hypothetical protein